jgi:hypothetical protein
LLGVVRRAYQHAERPGVGEPPYSDPPTKASAECGRDELNPRRVPATIGGAPEPLGRLMMGHGP